MAGKSRIFSEGEVIEGRYRIDGMLARGGMSILYRATFLENGKPVVIKQPKPDVDSRFDLYCNSIRHEANILSRLNHPQIVGYLDFIHKSDLLVMEFVEGSSLAELYECKKASVEDALALTKKLADALAYLHGAGMVHRDICPRNIIVDSRKVPHILDFGTAFDKNLDTCVTSRVFHGPYTSPELALGNANLSYSDLEACDIFSLGATLYYVLATSAPPILSRDTPCLSLRGGHTFDRLIALTTQTDPGQRMALCDLDDELGKIERLVRYKPVLRVVSSQEPSLKSGTLFFLDKARSKIGSSPLNDVHISSRFLTPIHAEITNQGNDWFLHDCNSTNRTFLNHAQVMPNDRKPLSDGDAIWLVYDPNKPKKPYIEMEFIQDKRRIEELYNELNNLDIQTSWDWDGQDLVLRTIARNDSKMPWKGIHVDYASMMEIFVTDRSTKLNFNLEPGIEQYQEIPMKLADGSRGGEFIYPMRMLVAGRLIREENIHIRYGQGFKPSTGLKIDAAKKGDAGRITVNMKIHNTSPYTYTRLCVGMNIPDGIELIHPDSLMRTIPTIGSNEEHIITYVMKPKRKMRTAIHFDVSYLDHMGRKKQADVEGIDTGEILPSMEPLDMEENQFISDWERLSAASRQTMYKDLSLQKARNLVSQACDNLFRVGESRDEGQFKLYFSGKPCTGRSGCFLMSCMAAESGDNLEIALEARSNDPEEADQFLQDQFDSINRAFRMDKAIMITQVTNVITIKDSMIYKSDIVKEPRVRVKVKSKDSIEFKGSQ